MYPDEENLVSPAEKIVDDAVGGGQPPQYGGPVSEDPYQPQPAWAAEPTPEAPQMGGMSAPYPPGYTWEEAATGVAPEAGPDMAEEPVYEEPPLAEAAPPKKKKKKKKPAAAAPEASKKEKKLAKKNKSQNRSKEKKRRSSVMAAKVLVFAIFGVAVAVQGLGRIEAAQALVGSTVLPPSISGGQDDQTDLPPGLEIPEEPDVEPTGTTYRYIDASRLDKKTPTDLAVWYLQEFPEDKMHNEKALGEFDTWYKAKQEEDGSFDGKFKEALAYVKQHPELLEPPKPEPPKKDEETPDNTEEPGSQPDTTPTPTPGDNQTGTGTTGGDSGSGTGTTTTPSSKYQHIDEAALNGFSAAQVANWVLSNFPPNGANWDYQALGEYYKWMDEKATKDSTFTATVQGYLQTMGWSGSEG